MGVIQIRLTKGQIAVLDAEDLDKVSPYKWCAYWNPSNHKFYAKTKVRGRTISMARLIIDAPRGALVDHRDGNTLDNRRNNLRTATAAENNRNRQTTNNQNRSGFAGVGWQKQIKRWRAWISLDGRYVHVGVFKELADAVRARKEAAAKYYGQFNPVEREF